MKTIWFWGFVVLGVLASCTTAGPPNIHSVLVWQGGALVSEVYRTGEDRSLTSWGGAFGSRVEFGPDTLHDLRSVSKSVVGLEAGIVLARHPGVTTQTPVLSLFPELAERLPGREGITVGHLLTMSSGLDWKEWGRGFFDSDETALVWDRDPSLSFLSKSPVAAPGTRFNYSGGSTQTLMVLLERLEGRRFLDLVQADLFRPLGIETWEWAQGTQGLPLAHAGLRLRPRDLGKLGELMLRHGRWGDTVVVPEPWIEASLASPVETGIDLFSPDGRPVGYGYQWWTGTVRTPQGPTRWSAAIGNGGQRLYVVPDRDLVVVITAGDYGDREIQRKVSAVFADLFFGSGIKGPSPIETTP